MAKGGDSHPTDQRRHDPEKNPLAFLDRLLDDERDSNLHFGDVRFWRHLEYIDTAQIYRTKSLEYRTLKMMFCEAVFHIIFLVILTLYIVELRSGSVYESRRQQLDYWGDCKRGLNGDRGEGGCDLYDLAETKLILPWLRNNFVPKTFTDKKIYPSIVDTPSIFRVNEYTSAWAPRYIGDTKTSVIIGSVRIRQLRVQYNKGCDIMDDLETVEWSGPRDEEVPQEFKEDCRPAFSKSHQSKMTWASSWTPPHILHHFQWAPEIFTEQTKMNGHYGVYPGSGFTFDLPRNLTGAVGRLKELEDWNWLDERSRALIIEFSTLNPNVNVMVHNRILFEMPATGGVVASHEVFPFRVLQLSFSLNATDELMIFVFFTFTCAMHLMLFLYVIYLMYKNGGRYFMYFWSICDLIILGVFFIWFITNLVIISRASLEPHLQPEVIADPEIFVPIGKLVKDMEFAGNLLAVLGLFTWLKIIKYFALLGPFQALVRVLERSILQLIVYGGLLFLVLFGFAAAFYAAYGGDSKLFSTLLGSFVACVVMPAGGVDLEPILSKRDVLGPLLLFLYILVILFLILQTFMAIVADTYSVITYQMSEVRQVSRSSPIAIFLWTYWNALKGVKLVGKESEDDKGNPDEQTIALSSLPEAIATRFIATKQRMIALLDQAEKEMHLEHARHAAARGDMLNDSQTANGGAGASNNSWGSKLPLENAQVYQALENERPFPPPSGDNMSATSLPFPPPSLPEHPPPPDPARELASIVATRVQLQRMLDEDPLMKDICETDRAIDVMRRFRVDHGGVDPYEAVARLQASVAHKLQELEDRGMRISFDETETLRTVSQELHNALTESQKEWRAELLSVMQMASLLSRALVELTLKLEQVQLNHNSLAMRASPNS